MASVNFDTTFDKTTVTIQTALSLMAISSDTKDIREDNIHTKLYNNLFIDV